MSQLSFTDGVTIDTSGPLRILQLKDGWYVAGLGFLIPCEDEGEAEVTIMELETADD